MAQDTDAPDKQGHWKKYNVRRSPFVELQSPFTLREAVKLVVLLPFFIPRTIIGVSACVVLASMSYIAALGWPLDKPFPKWRRQLVIAASKCARLVLLMLGFNIRIQGWGNVAKGRQIGSVAIFNHITWVDPIIMMWLFAPSGVSKDSNADLPLFGTCIKAFQNIYVPRGKKAGGSGKNVSKAIGDRVKDRRFPMLCMAPEGTCSHGRCILQFYKGAFVPGVPVLPVLLSYDDSCHNPAWVINDVLWSWVRMMHQFWNTVDVKILPPYVPSEAERQDAGVYAANVRKLYADTLKVPLVDQSIPEYTALCNLGVKVSWDGRRVTAPPGILDADGCVDLTHAKTE